MKVLENLIYDDKNALDLYLPDVSNDKTIIYIHGGGIETGDKSEPYIKEYGKIFTDFGYSFVSINYSLYPNTKFPIFIEDCAKAIKFIIDNAEKYNISKNLYISGSSAGAYITAMLMVNNKYLSNVNVDTGLIKGWICDDGQMTDHFNIQKYELGIDPWIQRISEYAPIYYINKNTRFSRLLLIYYDEDMPMRVEQNELFVKTIEYFNKTADISTCLFHGTHCQWTCSKNENGSFQFVNELLKWIK